MGFWTIVEHVIRKVQIVLLIVDARMPQLSKNELLESLVAKYDRRLVRVFTKRDLVSEEGLKELRRLYPDGYIVSGTKNIGVNKLKQGLMMMAKRMGLDRPKVGVVGYPNVGKSALINALAKRARTKVSSKAGTTRGVQWVKAGGLMILDSPGVVPMIDTEVRLAMIGAKNPEKIINPEKVACRIIKDVGNKNPGALKEIYGIDYGTYKGDYDAFLGVGKSRGFLLKGGIVDEDRTAMQIIRDWQRGKLRV
jgi:ribosome biogenesis GTPase A